MTRQLRVAGKIDWAALAAIVASIAALAATATSILTFRYLREEATHVQLTTRLDSLWHLDAQWTSGDMADTRSAAAAALLDAHPTPDVDAVLDFFDNIALLLQRGALDEEMVWHQFYWPMANYWLASQDYVRRARRDDPVLWQDLEGALPRLTAIEARRRRSDGQAIPTPAQIRDFLTAESDASECSEDDDEARRTPL